MFSGPTEFDGALTPDDVAFLESLESGKAFSEPPHVASIPTKRVAGLMLSSDCARIHRESWSDCRWELAKRFDEGSAYGLGISVIGNAVNLAFLVWQWWGQRNQATKPTECV